MQAVKRPYVVAAAALAATSLVAITPTASQFTQTAQRAVRSIETSLVDAESLANVPLNLFYDLVNIPANEIYATQFFTDNLFMAGPWFVVGPTNLWGVDPGDPTHFMSVMNYLVPFPALSGMDAPETDFSAGLGQQVWGFVASELPVSSSCDELACAPFEPASPITGLSGQDFFIWMYEVASGQEKQGLFDHWFNANYVNGQYFFNPAADGMSDPAHPGLTDGHVFGFDGWSSTSGLLGGQGIPGTGGEAGNLMPWAGETYTWEPWVPFQNFFNSLMATPSTTGLDGTGIDAIYGNPTEIAQTFQAFLAGLAFFDPITAGSPFCPGECTAISNAGLDYPNLIKDINNMTPGGNPVINEWLANLAGGPNAPDGGANVPNQEVIDQAIKLLQNHDFWDFGNPPYTGHEFPPGSPDIGTVYPEWQAFWTSLGFDTTNSQSASAVDVATLANGFGAEQLTADFAALANSFSPEQLAVDWAALFGAVDPAAVAGAVDPGAFDPAALLAAIGL